MGLFQYRVFNLQEMGCNLPQSILHTQKRLAWVPRFKIISNTNCGRGILLMRVLSLMYPLSALCWVSACASRGCLTHVKETPACRVQLQLPAAFQRASNLLFSSILDLPWLVRSTAGTCQHSRYLPHVPNSIIIQYAACMFCLKTNMVQICITNLNVRPNNFEDGDLPNHIKHTGPGFGSPSRASNLPEAPKGTT